MYQQPESADHCKESKGNGTMRPISLSANSIPNSLAIIVSSFL
jgi:hypothetical protein